MAAIDRMVDLEGRVIVVVGAAGDIGAQMAGLLLAQGAHVAAIDRDGDAMAGLQGRWGDGNLTILQADVTDEDAMARAFASLGSRLDGLVNGAGIENRPTPIDQLDTALFRKVLDVNVTGVFLGLKYGLPLMREKGGSVVNVASTAGIKGANGMSAYVASKHAVIGLTRSAAVEWGPANIRVNAICPGPVAGRMIDSIFGSKPGQPSPVAKARMEQIPSRRFGEPEEIARLTAYLLSDAAGFINGACYSIDGGISAI